MKFENQAVRNGAADIDWDALYQETIARLDVAAEFEALGVEFTRAAPNGKGIRECRAFGRSDEVPSAFVNVRTGVYHDSGGDGVTLDLFKFALRHGNGRWGRYSDAARSYAEKAGVPFGAVKYGTKGRFLEKVYPYHDAGGRLVFGVHRYRLPSGDKTFRQYPWRNDDWFRAEGCMDGVPLFPFRLPELLDADPEAPVWIVEGEKDVERLRSLGEVATCNPMGAGKWREEFDRWLRGRSCYIIPDNDPIGRQHAMKVAASLKGTARLVKVVELPGLPFHGDLSDWLDAGESLDDLGRLAHAAPEWSPEGNGEAAEADLSRDATVADLRACQSLDSWAWPLWIPNAALTLLAAELGTGKTRFCFDLCRRAFHGLTSPDGAVTFAPGGRSLWVVADNQWQEMCDIAAEFAIPDEVVILNAPASDPYAGTSLQTAEELADLEARIVRVRPAFVVIDTITNTGDFKSQDSADAKRQYKPLQEIAARCQVPIICVTHLNAGGKVLGRRAVEKVRVVIQLECPDPDGQPDRRKLWVPKSKAIKPAPLGVTMTGEGNEYDATPPEAPGPNRINGATGPLPVKTVECRNWLAELLSLGQARVSMIRTRAEQAGHSARTLYKAKDLLHVEETEEDGRKWWALPRNAENGHANGEVNRPF
jgi:hypothetical protein